MSPSRSRISLPSLAEKGMLWLFTEINPVEQAVSQLVFIQHFLLEKIKTGVRVGCEQREQTVRFKEVDSRLC